MNNLMLKVKQEEFYTAALVAAENLIETWGREPVVTNLEKQLYKWSLEGKNVLSVFKPKQTDEHLFNTDTNLLQWSQPFY